MNINLSRKIGFGCVVFLLLVQFAFAQTQPDAKPNDSDQSNRAAETMSEDDRLPFMQDERAPSAPESSAGGMLLRTLGAMLIIVGLIFFGAWGLKKFGAKFGLLQPHNLIKTNAPELAVLNSVSLGSGRTLAVIRFGERNLLVGSTAQNFTLLADETRDDELILPLNRSVSDLLDEENNLFAGELRAADSRLNFFDHNQS